MRGRHLKAAAVGIDESVVSIGVRLQAGLYAEAVHLSSLLQLLVVNANHDQSTVGHLHQPHSMLSRVLVCFLGYILMLFRVILWT